MTSSAQSPISRPVKVDDIAGGEMDVVVEATPQERAALAADFGLGAIDRLTGRYTLVKKGRFIEVTGRVDAVVDQICVVTLEPFKAEVGQPVGVRFAEPLFLGGSRREEGEESEADLDAPDPVENGKVDLGALTAEYLSLGLDPYPRKPGVVFAFEPEDHDDASPFAKLSALRRDDKS